ncbi:GNAT family acetyltransferase [Cellvibrio zantedeschiae]|uniref:GNAT family acetyltransferase n=1 Tax=Cellvibrio zantedeschiae TaxID=1237077 RepID=A0ABQ3AST8_9GAMM|nr:GNAT family N-acetyltransferase [Cellvibrio zantedeschiae]GGY66730.1 GNAT family acetyltransferase [Cellvibrio zantedeschiae]
MTYTFISTDWKARQQQLREIRELVFIQEQAVPVADEWDDKDESAIHFLVLTPQNNAIACARLLIENRQNQLLCHIGRVAVLSKYRNQSIGRNLMNSIITYCQQQYPEHLIYLNAQTTRQDFYEHLGFSARGAVFMDADIPHIEMWHSS